jgi:hypothetical protein
MKAVFPWKNEVHEGMGKVASSYFTAALVNPSIFDADYPRVNVQAFWLSSDKMKPIQNGNLEANDKINKPMGFRTDAVKNDSNGKIEQQKADLLIPQLYEALSKLKPLQLFPKVMDMEDAFWIVQLQEIKGAQKRIKVAAIQKVAFDNWLNSEIQKAPIVIYNKPQWDKMKKNVPNVDSTFRNVVFN